MEDLTNKQTETYHNVRLWFAGQEIRKDGKVLPKCLFALKVEGMTKEQMLDMSKEGFTFPVKPGWVGGKLENIDDYENYLRYLVI